MSVEQNKLLTDIIITIELLIYTWKDDAVLKNIKPAKLNVVLWKENLKSLVKL
jgi:hypothetical protein